MEAVREKSAVGGAQVGFNIQQGSFVWGVETDYTFGGLDRGPDLAGVFNGLPATIESHLNNVGTVRARLGIAIDRTMVYATAGGAWGDWRTRYKDFAVTPILIADNSVQWGWVAGGGIEHALTDTITLRLEGLYTSFDHQTVTVAHSLCGGNVSTPCKFEFDHDFWTLRLGLNYKFKGTF